MNRLCFLLLLIFSSAFSLSGKNRFAHAGITTPAKFSASAGFDTTAYQQDYIDAIRAKSSGQVGKAAVLFLQCLERDSTAAAAHFELAGIYHAVGDTLHTMYHARKAAAFGPDNVWYHLLLGTCYEEYGKADSALAVYRQALSYAPQYTKLHLIIAEQYLQLKQYRKALKALRQYELRCDDVEEAALARLKVDYMRGRPGKLAESLNACDALGQERPRFYLPSAEVCLSFDDVPKARYFCHRLLEQIPDDPDALEELLQIYTEQGEEDLLLSTLQQLFTLPSYPVEQKIELYVGLFGDSLFVGRHTDTIYALVDHLVEAAPDDPRVRYITLDRNVARQNNEGILDDLLFLSGKDKTNPLLWEQLCIQLYTTGDYERLYQKSDEAFDLFGGRSLLLYLHGIAALRLKQTNEAIATLTLLLRQQRGKEKEALFGDTLEGLAEAYAEAGRNGVSDSLYTAALQYTENRPVVLNNFSYRLAVRGDKLDLAEQMILQALEAEPESATFWDTYAWVYFKKRQLDKALYGMEQTYRFGGNAIAECLEHYIVILWTVGEPEKAREICREYLILTGTSSDAETETTRIVTRLNNM